MRAVCFDGTLRVCDRGKPLRQEGEVLIRTVLAGICNTDHEITKGYIPGFRGILGHEFLGLVEEADDRALVGKRVTAEINMACGNCELCRKGLGRHCSERKVLGIRDRDGAMAEYVTVPRTNIVEIPLSIPDESAIFIEPLSAALEILNQTSVKREHSVLLIGDGKLALLIAQVMDITGCDLMVLGKHPEKLALLNEAGIKTSLLPSFSKRYFDVVIEAAGSPSAFDLGLACVRPRGTFVIKSTYSGGFRWNPSSVVVDEITIIGSRCGNFQEAITFLETYRPGLKRMISREFPLEGAVEAFAYSARPDTLKVLLRTG